MPEIQVREERPRSLELFVGPRGRKNARAVHGCDLNSRLADSAARRKHQHIFAASELRSREQHVPGREKRQRKARRVHEARLIGDRDEVLHRHFDVLGVASGMVQATMVGINHNCWSTEHSYDGQDFIAVSPGAELQVNPEHEAEACPAR